MYNNKLQEHVNEDVWQIVDNIQQDIHTMFDEANDAENIGEFLTISYKSLLKDIVWQMSSLPADREQLGLEPMSDPQEIAVAYNEILDLISSAFGYDIPRIEKDMQKFMKKYTPDDIRTVRKLKRDNRLN